MGTAWGKSGQEEAVAACRMSEEPDAQETARHQRSYSAALKCAVQGGAKGAAVPLGAAIVTRSDRTPWQLLKRCPNRRKGKRKTLFVSMLEFTAKNPQKQNMGKTNKYK